MKQYKDYEVDDFLSDDNFIRWVRAGSPSAGSVWQDFQATYPEKKADLEKARAFILQTLASGSLSDAEQSEEIDRILATAALRRGMSPSGTSLRFSWWQAAAAVVVLTGIALTVWRGRSTPPAYAYDQLVKTSSLPLKEVANVQSGPQLVLLPDGSRVTLSADSRISFARDLDKQANREVFLTGDAFFEVTRNPQQPFLVYADGLATRVVGTSFSVQTGNKKVSVVVRTGRVMVYPMQTADTPPLSDEKSILTPNQQATFMTDNLQITRSLAEAPQELEAHEAGRFQFDNTSIDDVFSRLENAYGVPIVYDKAIMKNCRLTVPMGDEPFFTKLDIICRAIGAGYKVDNTQVVITSTGCDE
ncbi:MAG: hypothetical protein ABS46_12990 [Cytophagaceae bacterium SCN 52-12]|nr:MAG: hypothetical protein ABS46_12990 [Cytophagaceae bacterium SCN 52-12]